MKIRIGIGRTVSGDEQICIVEKISSVTVTRMIVPCCGGIEFAVKQAIEASGKNIACKIVTIDTNGEII